MPLQINIAKRPPPSLCMAKTSIYRA